jgi:chromosome segregation ATPase
MGSYTQPVRVRFKRGRDAIKRALDRRYVTRDELEVRTEPLADVDGSVDGVVSRLASIESTMSRLAGNVAELEKRLQGVERLSDECARAIESVLQAELLLRRDLDAISNI